MLMWCWVISPYYDLWLSLVIALSRELWLDQVFILSVTLYGAKTWSPTRQLSRDIGTFHQWCLCRILWISWRECISNEKIHRHSDQPPLILIICTTHLKFFDHIAHANPWLTTAKHSGPVWPRDWNRRSDHLVKLGSGQLNPMSLH